MMQWHKVFLKIRDFFRKFLSIRVFGYYNLHDLYENIEKIGILEKTGLMFEVHLADHCNLNCRGCSHFSPVSKPYILSPSVYAKDILRLSEVLPRERVRRIRLLGGEPLLNPYVEEIISLTIKAYPNVLIELVTNGLLLAAQSKSFWATCRNNSIVILISRYPIPIDIEGITSIARNEGVKLVIGPTGKYKSFFKWVFDINGKQNAFLSHIFCFNNGYTCQLKDGRFYPCSASAYYENFANRFSIKAPDKELSSLDIYNSSITTNDFFKLIRHPVEMCKYCNMKKKTPNAGWALSKKEIDEWT